MIKGIDHIDIAVKDVEASVALFEKMGFKVLRRQLHKGGTAELALPGPDQFILDIHPAVPGGLLDGKPGLFHIAFKVDDPQEVQDQLADRGVRFRPGSDAVRYIASTGRTVGNVIPAQECLGEWYLQLVGPVREEPPEDQRDSKAKSQK